MVAMCLYFKVLFAMGEIHALCVGRFKRGPRTPKSEAISFELSMLLFFPLPPFAANALANDRLANFPSTLIVARRNRPVSLARLANSRDRTDLYALHKKLSLSFVSERTLPLVLLMLMFL